MERPKVYIAGPYTKGDVAVNVRKVITTADKIANMGAVPYLPHLSHFWHLVTPRQYTWWLDYDLEWLRVCDVLLRLDGESAGADDEVKQAKVWGIPVVLGIGDLERWLVRDWMTRDE